MRYGSSDRFTRRLLCTGATLVMLLSMALVVYGRPHAKHEYTAIDVSPDGRAIAFQVPAYSASGDLLTEIHVVDLASTSERVAARIEGVWDLHWQDNEHLLGTLFDAAEIHVISVRNGKDRVISLTSDFDWAQPSTVPGGKWVAFPAVKTTPTRQCGLFAIGLSDGKIKQLSDAVIKSYVSWSPDGKSIAYGVGDYEKDYSLQITDVASGTTTDLKKNGVGVSWSPDGQWIAYTGGILKGGSWWGGVPADGRIRKTNVKTGETADLSGAPSNATDEKSGIWEFSGDIVPKWSPDGSHIAYQHIHQKMDKQGKRLIGENQLWVMRPDGSGQKMVSDKWQPFVWSKDGKSIFLHEEKAITRISIDTGDKKEIASWKIPEKPEPKESDYKTMEKPGASIRYRGVTPEYAKAVLSVTAAAREIYANQYHCNVPDRVTINLEKDSSAYTNLWNDGQSQIFLTVESLDKLAPPKVSGTFNIYGLCHEIGHMVMYRQTNFIGLPGGIGEAWADYAGSVVEDEVYKKLGQSVWPERYDYSQEGMKRFRANSTNKDLLNDDRMYRVGAKFLILNDRYGAAKVFAAMNDALSGGVYGKDLMPKFIASLGKLTGDKSVAEVFPKEMVSTEMRWEVADRAITDAAVEGLSAVPDASGITLKYDDGKSDGKQSTAGSGHGIMFKRPAGDWAVDSVEMYGSRYGTPEPPKDNFQIFICDADFNVLKQIDEPYSKLTYDEKWYKFDFEPVSVPEGFYVCIFFNPTATKGFYMNYDSDVKKSHSKSALPWTFIRDLNEKYDWMIRAHLKKKG